MMSYITLTCLLLIGLCCIAAEKTNKDETNGQGNSGDNNGQWNTGKFNGNDNIGSGHGNSNGGDNNGNRNRGGSSGNNNGKRNNLERISPDEMRRLMGDRRAEPKDGSPEEQTDEVDKQVDGPVKQGNEQINEPNKGIGYSEKDQSSDSILVQTDTKAAVNDDEDEEIERKPVIQRKTKPRKPITGNPRARSRARNLKNRIRNQLRNRAYRYRPRYTRRRYYDDEDDYEKLGPCQDARYAQLYAVGDSLCKAYVRWGRNIRVCSRGKAFSLDECSCIDKDNVDRDQCKSI